MADTPAADSIQIEIVSSSDKAISNLNKLADSLQQLKSAASGYTASLKNIVTGINSLSGIKEIKNLDTVSRQLEALKRAANGFANNAGENLVLVAAGLKSFSGLSISKTAAENMTKLSDALRNIHEKDAKRITAVAQSMTAIAQVPSMTRAINQLDKLPEVLDRLQGANITGIAGKMRELADAMVPLADRMKDIYAGFSSLPGNIQDIIKNARADLPNGQRSSETDTVESEDSKRNRSILNAIPKIYSAAATAMGALKKAAQSAWSVLKKLAKISFSAIKKGFELVASGAKKLGSALATIGKGIASAAVSGIKSLVSAVGHRFTAPFEKAVSAITKFKNAIGRIIFYRAVRGAIRGITEGFKTGVEDLYQYSRIVNTEFAPAMDSLATSALYVKNSLGAMVAPIIQAIAPAVQFLAQKFAELTAAIGKAFAALTGKKTFSQAVRFPKKYAEAANSATKASKKAKDATDDYAEAIKNFTLGIDELNVIDIDTDNGLKDKLKNETPDLGDASGIDYGSMFEEVEIPVETLDWANQIREAIEKGDWYSVGEIVATKMNEVVDGWDFYGWGKSLSKAINKGLKAAIGFLKNFKFDALGSKIATGFNGLADGLEWETLGNVIAAKYNALYDFVYGFATSLNWYYIGEDISTAFNGFLDELDPDKASNAVTFFFTGLYDLIYGAITGINWDTLGKKFAQFVNGVNFGGILYGALNTIIIGLSALKTTIDSFLDNWDWSGMATQIYTAINDTLANGNIDWNGIGETLGNLIDTAIQFAGTFLEGLDFTGIGETVGSIVNGFFEGINWDKAGTAVSSGITGIFDFLLGFIGKLNWPLIATSVKDALVGGFNNAEQWLKKINWENVGENAYNEFKKAVGALKFDEIARSFFRLFGTALGSFVSILSGFISGVIDDIKDYFSQYIEDAKDKWGDNGGAIILGILQGILDAMIGIGTWIKENIFEPFIEGFKSVFGIHSPSTVMKGYGENIMQGAINGVSGKEEEFVKAAKNPFNSISSFLDGEFSTSWEKSLGSLSSNSEETFNGMNKYVDKTFKKDWETSWEGISSTFKDVWNGMIGIVEGAANKIISGVNWMIRGLNKIGIEIPDFLGGGKIGFDIPQISEIKLPRLMASGGFVDSGQMFIARERGPELVGNIGQKTAVVNNEQIITGISRGVENANEEQNALLREQNELLRALLNKDTTVRIGNKEIKRAYDTATRQSGASIMAGGVMA